MKYDDILKMPLEEKINQTIVILMNRDTKVDFCPGGAFFFGQIITEADESGLDELRSYVGDLLENCEIPPLITSDFENGCGSMVKGLTPLPYLMALGATGDSRLAYDYGKATALEARSIGVNWSFSPVSDLNMNRRNPLVNTRSLSDNALLAEKLLPQIIRGMQDNGISACAKHFPGDGVDYRDQHITTTINSLSVDDWRNTFGRVYKKLIESGLNSVMAGHIAFPAYASVKDGGHFEKFPATLNPALIIDLLKGELGFKGIVVTDALGMGGFSGWYESREASELEAFKAGCDMMLWPTEGYAENLKKAVLAGKISMDRINDAVTRILNVKQQTGLFNRDYKPFRPINPDEKEFVKQVQRKCSDKSMTLVRDRAHHFPLSPSKTPKIGIIPIFEFEPAGEDAKKMATAFRARGFKVDYCEKSLLTASERREMYDRNDIIIYVLLSRPFRPMGFLDYTADRAAQLAGAFSPDKAVKKTIFVSLGSPYFGKQYLELADTYVNGYSMLGCAAEAFVRASCGEILFEGKSPVEL